MTKLAHRIHLTHDQLQAVETVLRSRMETLCELEETLKCERDEHRALQGAHAEVTAKLAKLAG